jgi:bifunctional UDP-N-acetylglucosamine pyrophosphorylase/glucosamine-1-phosphate N-acetyltransferase
MDFPWEPRTVSRAILRDLAAPLVESQIAEGADVSPDANIDGPVVIKEGAIIHAGATIHGPAWIGRDTQVYEGSQIAAHTMVGRQCRIGPFAKVSGVVGDDCHITYLGEFGGVMLDGGRVTHQIQLSGIFGLGAEIGAGTQTGTLRFDDGPIEVIVQGRRRIAEGFSGVLFGDFSRTGVGAMMMPGRIIGPCAMVGAGVVLMHNVPPHKAVLLEQNTRLIDWSPATYDR